MIKNFFDPTMIRFFMVGVINTLVGTGTMFLLYNFAGCSYWFSSAANYVVGGCVSYFLNKFFTFRNREKSWFQVLKFIMTVVFCYFIGFGVAKPVTMWLLDTQPIVVQENIAMCIGMCLYVVLNYFIQKFIVFNTNIK